MKNREQALLVLLDEMARTDGPIGTRFAARALEAAGMQASESSVSRMLRELDVLGWTTPVGTKGRVLSPSGRERVRDAAFSARASENLSRAVDIRDLKDLLDLLRARQLVESAVAGSAATSATPAQVATLRALLRQHETALGSPAMSEQPGLTFHRVIAGMTTNRMLGTLTAVVLAPHLDGVEAVLDIILGSKHQSETVVHEHSAIVDAIERNDAGAAERAMHAHFETMMQASERFIQNNQPVFERLLAWAEGPGSTNVRQS